MSITTNLVIGIPEAAIGGDRDAVLIKTTQTGDIIIEMTIPKVGIKVQDLEEAIIEVKTFLNNRPTLEENIERSSIETEEEMIAAIPEFEFGDNIKD